MIRFLLIPMILLLSCPALAKARYLAEPGLYVSDIAQREYNTPTFAKVIESFNKISATDLKPGTPIATPRLEVMLMEAGFPSTLKATAFQLSSAFKNIQTAQTSLKGSQKQNARVRSRLNRALATLRSVRKNLINNAKPESPYMMIAKVDSIIKGVDAFLRKKSAPSQAQFKWLYKEFASAYLKGIEWGRTRKKLASEQEIAH